MVDALREAAFDHVAIVDSDKIANRMLSELGTGDCGALLVQLDCVNMSKWGDGADERVSI